MRHSKTEKRENSGRVVVLARQGGAWAGIEGDAPPVPAKKIPFLGCPDCEG